MGVLGFIVVLVLIFLFIKFIVIPRGLFGTFNVSNNFEFIAVNVKTIHTILKKYYSDYFDNEKHLFMTCGAIDMIQYLKAGQVSAEDLEMMYICGNLGKCRIGVTVIEHVEGIINMFVNQDENIKLLNFILQLECVIFDKDSPTMNPRDIIGAVISMKPKIHNALKKYNSNNYKKLYEGLRQVIDQYMVLDEFAAIKREIAERAQKK